MNNVADIFKRANMKKVISYFIYGLDTNENTEAYEKSLSASYDDLFLKARGHV